MSRVVVVLSAIALLGAVSVISSTVAQADSYADFGGERFDSDFQAAIEGGPINVLTNLLTSFAPTGIMVLDFLFITPLQAIIAYELIRIGAEAIPL